MIVAILFILGTLFWVVVATLAARLWLPRHFLNKPRLGLFLWFLTLGSAVVAMALSLGAAIWSYLETVRRLGLTTTGSGDWLLVLIMSFVPWFALAATGVLLSLIKLRLDPSLGSASTLSRDLVLSETPLRVFNSVQVSTIDLGFHYAFSTANEIVVSSHSVSNLNSKQLDAIFWHELGHIRQKHHLLKSITGYVDTLTKPMSVSKVFRSSVDELCEIAADDFAKRRTDPLSIDQVREIMKDSR